MSRHRGIDRRRHPVCPSKPPRPYDLRQHCCATRAQRQHSRGRQLLLGAACSADRTTGQRPTGPHDGGTGSWASTASVSRVHSCQGLPRCRDGRRSGRQRGVPGLNQPHLRAPAGASSTLSACSKMRANVTLICLRHAGVRRTADGAATSFLHLLWDAQPPHRYANPWQMHAYDPLHNMRLGVEAVIIKGVIRVCKLPGSSVSGHWLQRPIGVAQSCRSSRTVARRHEGIALH